MWVNLENGRLSIRWAVHSRAMAYRVGRCTNKRQKQIEPFTTWGVGTWWNSLLGVFKHHSIHILMIWRKWQAIPFGPEKKVSNARRSVATLPSLMSLLGWCCSLQSYSFPRRWPVSNVVVVDPMINLAPLGHWHVGMLSGWTLGLPWLNTTCSWTYLNLASCWCHQWGKDGHSESLLRREVRWIRHPEAFSFCTLDTNRKICSKHGMKHVN